jgi:hypothetical protein
MHTSVFACTYFGLEKFGRLFRCFVLIDEKVLWILVGVIERFEFKLGLLIFFCELVLIVAKVGAQFFPFD